MYANLVQFIVRYGKPEKAPLSLCTNRKLTIIDKNAVDVVLI